MSSSVFNKPEYIAAAFPYRFDAELHVGTLAGGRPRDPKVAEGWLRTKLADKDEIIRAAVAEVMLEQGVTVEEAEKTVDELKHLSGFSRDEHGLFVHGYQVKACLKEAASVAVNEGKIRLDGWAGPGVNKNYAKTLKNWLPEHVFVVEDRIPLGRDEPDDVVQSFPENKRMKMRGIQYNEYVTDAKVVFTVITDHDFADVEWAMLWLTAEQQGLGAMRSQGFGRFEVTRWERQP